MAAEVKFGQSGESFLRHARWLREHPALALSSALVGVFSLHALSLYARVVNGRVGYPYDLEWMEGGMVDHVLRILNGQPLYAAPTLEFVPFIYNPLYYELAAGVTALIGPGPPALRLVSVTASIAIAVFLYVLVRSYSGNRLGGVAAVGAFFATYALSGGWIDIARVDATFLALTLAAVTRARESHRLAWVESSALVVCAFLTKQYAITIAAPIAIYLLCTRGFGVALRFGVVTSGLAAGAVGILQVLSGGWYWFWTFRVPARHGFLGTPFADAFREHLSGPLPFLLALALFGSARLLLRGGRALRRKSWSGAADPALLLGTAGVLCVQAWLSFDHPGRFLNCLMPAHLALGLLAGVAFAEAARLAWPVQLACAAAFAVQLWQTSYTPRTWIPSRADRRAAAVVEQRLRDADGTLVLACRGFYGAPGVNPTRAHSMAVWDLFAARFPKLEVPFRKKAKSEWQKGKATRVLLDENEYVLMPELQAHFHFVTEEPFEAAPGGTRTGAPMRPRIVYERNPKSPRQQPAR